MTVNNLQAIEKTLHNFVECEMLYPVICGQDGFRVQQPNRQPRTDGRDTSERKGR